MIIIVPKIVDVRLSFAHYFSWLMHLRNCGMHFFMLFPYFRRQAALSLISRREMHPEGSGKVPITRVCLHCL